MIGSLGVSIDGAASRPLALPPPWLLPGMEKIWNWLDPALMHQAYTRVGIYFGQVLENGLVVHIQAVDMTFSC